MKLLNISFLILVFFVLELNTFTQIHPPYQLLQPSRPIFNSLNLEPDILYLNKKIIKIASKSPNKMKLNANQIHHIFWLEYNGPFKKKIFLSKQFLKFLTPSYHYERKCLKHSKTLGTNALICNEEGKIIASFSGVSVISNYIYDTVNQIIVNKLINKEIDYCFYISNTHMCTYFGVKGSKVYVFNDCYDKNIIQFSLHDFINNYWDIFYERSFLLRIRNSNNYKN